MAIQEIKWLHSHGSDNKDPNYDLGGEPSKFEIAELSTNNLFGDATPEQANEGFVDWRCFYIANKYIDTNYVVNLQLTPATYVDITFGCLAQNEQQKFTFQGPSPTDNGFFIIQMNWGQELTIRWKGSYAAMAADMQSQIRTVKYHTGVTVTVDAIFPSDAGATFIVEFAGDLKNRRMGLVKILQNNLSNAGHQEYRVDNTGATPTTWNWQGTNKVQVHDTISLAPDIGMIHVPYPYADLSQPQNWQYMHLPYSSWAGNLFNLDGVIPTIPLPDISFTPSIIKSRPRLGNNDEVWVDLPNPQNVTLVNVTKYQEGSPINQFAALIERDIDTPTDWDDQGLSFDVGLIRPLESFFVWVRREINAGQTGCKDQFSIELIGSSV